MFKRALGRLAKKPTIHALFFYRICAFFFARFCFFVLRLPLCASWGFRVFRSGAAWDFRVWWSGPACGCNVAHGGRVGSVTPNPKKQSRAVGGCGGAPRPCSLWSPVLRPRPPSASAASRPRGFRARPEAVPYRLVAAPRRTCWGRVVRQEI